MLCTDVSGKPTTSFCCLSCSWPVPIVGYQPHYSYTSQELINWRTLSSNVEIMRGVLAVDGDLWCPAWYQISVEAATGGGRITINVLSRLAVSCACNNTNFVSSRLSAGDVHGCQPIADCSIFSQTIALFIVCQLTRLFPVRIRRILPTAAFLFLLQD